MKKKPRVILISVFLLILIMLGAGWAFIELVFIPEVVVPEIQEFIDTGMPENIKLAVKDVSFHPLRGFLFHDVKLSGPITLKDNYILQAEEVDIDLALLPLLRKRVEILLFKMKGVDLNIGRCASGEWNFQPLLDLDFMKETEVGEVDFVIKKIVVKDCWIDYTDFHKKDNMLEKRFSNVTLSLTSPRKNIYKLKLSGASEDGKRKVIKLNLDYNAIKKSAKGKFNLNIAFLGEYWAYYLDDVFAPWHLRSDNVDIEGNFSYQKQILRWQGRYKISNGIVSYGDLSIKADVSIKQELIYEKGKPDQAKARIDVSLENASSLSGNHVFIENGKCQAVITHKEIIIEKLIGKIKDHAVYYTGKFSFTKPRELFLTGHIGDLKNTLNLQLTTDNQGTLKWQAEIGEEKLEIKATAYDLKNMDFGLDIQGEVNLPEISNLLMMKRESVYGKISIQGSIKGELDKPNSWQGDGNIGIKDLELWKINLGSSNIKLDIKNGVCTGKIPKHDFYLGKFHGTIKMDLKDWGLEFHIDNLDIADFAKTRPKLEGMKGFLTGSVAHVCEWENINSLTGGSYIKLTNANLWNAPILNMTEKGIEEVATKNNENLKMPELKRINGNFHIKDQYIVVDNVFCEGENMTLRMSGKCSFSGRADLTGGVRFESRGFFQSIRDIIIPINTLINVMSDCIQIKITGQLPDQINNKSQIQPAGWLKTFFPTATSANPKKYTLKKLWHK